MDQAKKSKILNYIPKILKWSLVIIVPLVLYFAVFNHVEPARIGLARNWITGKYWVQGPGMHFTWPWIWVADIDTRPMKVSVCSAGHGYSSKLVQFNAKYWQEFLSVEGWRYYWLDNRISFNYGHKEEFRGLRNIMRGHAYGVEKYDFITIITEYK